MRICENGKYRDATRAEIAAAQAAQENLPVPPVTDAERIEALEAAVLELAEVVLNG